jgi:hypothetical protein
MIQYKKPISKTSIPRIGYYLLNFRLVLFLCVVLCVCVCVDARISSKPILLCCLFGPVLSSLIIIVDNTHCCVIYCCPEEGELLLEIYIVGSARESLINKQNSGLEWNYMFV